MPPAQKRIATAALLLAGLFSSLSLVRDLEAAEFQIVDKLSINGPALFKSSATWQGVSAPPLPPSGSGALYFDSGSGTFKISEGGSAYVGLFGGFWSRTSGVIHPATLSDRLAIGRSDLSGATLLVSTNTTASPALFVNATSGNVGIGTSAPGLPLHVEASRNADSVARIKNANAADGFGLEILAGTASTDANYILQLADALGNERFRVLSSGKVGIGTTSPSNRLSVAGNANLTGDLGVRVASPGRALHVYNDNVSSQNAGILAELNQSGTPTYRFLEAKNSGGTNLPQVTFELEGTSAKAFDIWGKAGGASLASLLHARLDSGNIGIGTVAPGARLHVSSAGAASADLIFQVSTGSSAGQEVMVVRGDGSVGLGTTNPSNGINGLPAKLVVNLKNQTNGAGLHLLDLGDAPAAISINQTGIGSNFRIGRAQSAPFNRWNIHATNDTILYSADGNVYDGSPQSHLFTQGTELVLMGLRKMSGQTKDILQFQDSAGVAIASVTANGSFVTGASVTASAFFGSGSGLTGINAGLLAGSPTFSTVTVTGGAFSIGGSTFVVSEGNIGVGTTAPGTGEGFTGPNRVLEIAGTAATVNAPVLSLNRLATGQVAKWNIGVQSNKNFEIFDVTGGVLRPFRIEQGSPDNSLFLRGVSGNIGLNTTSPGARLEVKAAAADTALVIVSSQSGTAMLIMDRLGNLGVGATAPAARLHVSSGMALFDGTGSGLTVNNAATNAVVAAINCGDTADCLRLGRSGLGGLQFGSDGASNMQIKSVHRGMHFYQDSFGYATQKNRAFLFDQNGGTGVVVLAVKGIAGQTGDLQEWQNSADVSVASVTADGSFVTGASVTASAFFGDGSGLTNVTASGSPTFSTVTVTGSAFSVGSSTLAVTGGRVGVGTANPGSNLEVNGGASPGTMILNSSPNLDGRLYFGPTGSFSTSIYGYRNAGSAGRMDFYVDNAIQFRVLPNAVAIGGAITPQSALGVNGSVAIGSYSGTAAPANGMIVSGNVGIGVTSPQRRLDVAGDVNTNSVYEIGGSTVLSVNGSQNLFAGVFAGTSTTTGSNSVILGHRAGTALTTGAQNTFVGSEAGVNHTDGNYATLLGYRAGYANTASGNTFLGHSAGQFNTTGGNNLFVGASAGYNNTTGHSNTIMGGPAGFKNTTGYQNTFVGFNAGYENTTGYGGTYSGAYSGANNTTGSLNTFYGYQTGYNNSTGGSNTFLGYQAGSGNTTGSDNTLVGLWAGSGNTTGVGNAFVGNLAGYQNAAGQYNSILGANAGQQNVSGSYNVMVGHKAGQLGTVSNYNTFVGAWSGYNSTGAENTMVGYSAGQGNTTGVFNTFLGNAAGSSNTTASSNTLVGYKAGEALTTGQGNVFLGFKAGASETGSNKLYIANNTGMPLIYGDFSAGAVGLGTTGPASKLHVLDGDIRISTSPSAASRGIIFQDGTVQNTAATGGTLWADRGSNRISNTNSGSVGIGTTNPEGRLDVNGLGIVRSTSAAVDHLILRVLYNSGSSLLSANQSGQVCVNRESPCGFNFSVGGSSELTGNTRVGTGCGAGSRLCVTSDNGTTPIAAFEKTTGDRSLYINAQGSVGIGTGSPITKLHMSSGTLTIDGNATNSIIANGNVGLSSATPTERLVIGSESVSAGTRNVLRMNAGWSDPALGDVGGDRLILARNENVKTAIGFGGANDMWFQTHGPASGPAFRWFYNTSGNEPTERMRLDVTGKLGIGATNPTGLLHVKDTTTGTSSRLLVEGPENNSVQNVADIHFKSNVDDAGAGRTILKIEHTNPAGATPTGYLLKAFGDSASVGTATDSDEVFALKVDGTAFFNGGSVGIGTTAPTAILDLSKSAANAVGPEIRMHNPAGSGAEKADISFYSNGEIARTVVRSSLVSGLGELGFYVQSGDLEAVRIRGSGNVGIGTTSAGQKLTVAGTIESTTGGVKFPDGTTQTTAAGAGGEANTYTSSKTFTAAVGLATQSGSVGIGTTNPGQKLTVAGTIESTTGGVKFPDGNTQSRAIRIKAQEFTTVGANTWTKPSGVSEVEVFIIGGGGGGGAGNSGSPGGGGGAGGLAYQKVSVSGDVTVTIGGGGASGTAGTSSTFGALLTANGGGAGGPGVTSTSSTGGNGGCGGGSGGDTGAAGGGGGISSAGGNAYYSNSESWGFGSQGGPGGRSNSGSSGVSGDGGLGAVIPLPGDFTSSLSRRRIGGGGGGGRSNASTGGQRAGVGQDGGGDGGVNAAGSAAAANTGGGGGGGGVNSSGGAGGSGYALVIWRE